MATAMHLETTERQHLLAGARQTRRLALEGFERELSRELEAAEIEVQALGDGVASGAAATKSSFDKYSRLMLERHTTLRSTTLLPNDVIAAAYPANPTLLGLDVGRHPIQGGAVVLMRQERRPIASGPIQLKQGGLGLVIRTPIWIRRHNEKRYWGHASAVFDVGRIQKLLDDFQKREGFPVNLTDSDGVGQTAQLALGVAFKGTSLSHKVHFAQESWTLRVPQVSLAEAAPRNPIVVGFGLVVATALGATTLLLGLAYIRAKEQNLRLAVSERRALAAANAKATFLATMSHELRTPLNGVIATAQLLTGTPLSVDQRQLTDTIASSSHALLAVINDVLDFSKLEAGKMAIESVATPLAQLGNELRAIALPLAEARGIQFELAVATDLPEAIFADPTRLRQVLLNLISNAIKFTEQGHVKIRFLKTPSPKGDAVTFVVEDSGIGIKDPESLFQEFTQAESSTTRRFGGTGLGLAISERIVRLMGGHLAVQSELGEGSRFAFSVPLREAVLQEPQSEPVLAPALHTGRCLVVDDNQVNRMVARKVLNKLGWEVVLAEGGAEALQAVEHDTFDLIFMDCQMPEIDGFEATARLRANPKLRATPIIALTANAETDDKAKCLAAGMSDHLAKPIRVEAVREALERWHPRGRDAQVAPRSVRERLV